MPADRSPVWTRLSGLKRALKPFVPGTRNADAAQLESEIERENRLAMESGQQRKSA